MQQIALQSFQCQGCKKVYCIGREPVQISLTMNICAVCLAAAKDDPKQKKKVVTINNKDYKFFPTDPVPNEALKQQALRFYDSPATMKEIEFVYNKRFISGTGYQAIPKQRQDLVTRYEQKDLIGDAKRLKTLVTEIHTKAQQYLNILTEIESIELQDGSKISQKYNEIISFCLNAPYTFPKVVDGLQFPYYQEDGDVKESSIVKPVDWNLIQSWLPTQNNHNIKTTLLFRAQTDGFQNFHAKCDGKGRTVVIARFKEFVFGGYSAIPWHSDEQYSGDPTYQSFIFSVNNQSQHNLLPVEDPKQKYDIFGSSAYGPTFGGGHDLKIGFEHCHANLGFSYEAPNGYPKGSEDCRQYLAGEEYFAVDDYEVYLMN